MFSTRTGLALCITAFAMSATAQVTGSGTSGTVPVFTGTSTVGNSPITVSGDKVGIGTPDPASLLDLRSPGGVTATALTMGANGSTYGSYQIIRADVGNGAGSTIYRENYGWSDTSWQYSNNSGPTYTAMELVGAGGDGSTLFIDNPSNNRVISLSGNGASYFTAGNVGIGTTNPGAKLEINGGLRFSNDAAGTVQTTAWTGVLCGGDYAEAMNAAGGKKAYSPGDVLVLADGDNGDVQKSSEPYSTMVAGIYATKPGVIGKREALAKSSEDIPMAMIGVVPTKVSAENGSIKKGDLLVSSSTPGYAMRGTDRSRLVGAVIGKAMGTIDTGTGVIEVLVTLQ